MTTEATAYLSWSLDIDCPKCNESIDLSDDDDDNVVSGAIFHNNWDALDGHEVTCKHCAHEFKVKTVEY